jgi:O-antigen/teichoic acid export membrane protein
VPIAVGGLVLAPEIARAVAGDEFSSAATPLRLLLCASVPAWISGLLGYALIAGGRQRSVLALSVAALVLNVALNLALVPSYGPNAAAAVALGSEAFLVAGGWVLVRRQLQIAPRLALLCRALPAAAVMAAVVWWQRDLSLAILVPGGALVYLAVLAGVGGVDRRTLEGLRA